MIYANLTCLRPQHALLVTIVTNVIINPMLNTKVPFPNPYISTSKHLSVPLPDATPSTSKLTRPLAQDHVVDYRLNP